MHIYIHGAFIEGSRVNCVYDLVGSRKFSSPATKVSVGNRTRLGSGDHFDYYGKRRGQHRGDSNLVRMRGHKSGQFVTPVLHKICMDDPGYN